MELVGTVLAGAIVAVLSSYFTSRFYVHRATADLRQDLARRFNEQKWDAYTGFADTVRRLLGGTTGLGEHEPQERARELLEFTGRLWLVGSDAVLQRVAKWKELTTDERNQRSPLVMVVLCEILIEMRRDLGYEETELEPRDIMATFINDPDEALRLMQQAHDGSE